MRTLVALSIALLGMAAGFVLDLINRASGMPDGFILAPAGFVVGLLVGIVVARLVIPSRKPKGQLDRERYPNRIIDRR